MDQIGAPRRYVENLVLEGLGRVALDERAREAARKSLKVVK
jgi:hypothetical protein